MASASERLCHLWCSGPFCRLLSTWVAVVPTSARVVRPLQLTGAVFQACLWGVLGLGGGQSPPGHRAALSTCDPRMHGPHGSRCPLSSPGVGQSGLAAESWP